MLSTNIVSFKQNLNKLLNTTEGAEGAVYTAAYNAYFNLTNVELDTNSEDSDIQSILESASEELKEKIENDAKQFATDFCNGLKDNNFMETIADEVDKHIKSMKLVINVLPQGMASIVSPVGPCTGTLVVDDPTTATIQIL